MPWYKAWLETRSRFLISLGGIVAICSYTAWDKPGHSLNWYYFGLQQAHGRLSMMWVLAVSLLMMGGLVREKAVGASAFTLALPVSRTRLMSVRIWMGVIQAVALAVVPWTAMFLISTATGEATSVFQAIFHVLLLAGGGLVFFGLALLVSSLIEGEYTAPAVSLGLVFLIGFALADKPLDVYSPWNFILGSEYFDRSTSLLTGPIPWLHLTVSVIVAALLTLTSIKVIQLREF